MRTALLAPLALSVLLLASCGENPSDPGPGGVTVSEAKALDDAAAMLDQRRAPPPATPAPAPSATKEAAQ